MTYNHNINNCGHYSYNHINNEQLIHSRSLARLILNTKHPIAATIPQRNTLKETAPEPVGTKKPIMIDATKILDISAKYFATNSN